MQAPPSKRNTARTPRMVAPRACRLWSFLGAHGRRHRNGIAVGQFPASTKADISVEIRGSQQNFGRKSQDRAGPVVPNNDHNNKNNFLSALPLANTTPAAPQLFLVASND